MTLSTKSNEIIRTMDQNALIALNVELFGPILWAMFKTPAIIYGWLADIIEDTPFQEFANSTAQASLDFLKTNIESTKINPAQISRAILSFSENLDTQSIGETQYLFDANTNTGNWMCIVGEQLIKWSVYNGPEADAISLEIGTKADICPTLEKQLLQNGSNGPITDGHFFKDREYQHFTLNSTHLGRTAIPLNTICTFENVLELDHTNNSGDISILEWLGELKRSLPIEMLSSFPI